MAEDVNAKKRVFNFNKLKEMSSGQIDGMQMMMMKGPDSVHHKRSRFTLLNERCFLYAQACGPTIQHPTNGP